jgi:hypothetical protein
VLILVDLFSLVQVKDVIFWIRVNAMVFNVTFNNISVKLWHSVLLVVETRENNLPTLRLSRVRTENKSDYRH